MLGIIADDFTGATDVATMLRRSKHQVAVVIEDGDLPAEQLSRLDAVVIALKTRTAPLDEAVTSSRNALQRLRAWGATRYYVKYCSTFDSTPRGNIGPILDALCNDLGVTRCIAVPSLPANGRTVYQGHLFVGSELLEDSSMRDHPLTPMTESKVASLLQAQSTHPVGEISLPTVRQGPARLRQVLAASTDRYVVIDAIDDTDLRTIAAATAGDTLVSGGSGLALGMSGPGTLNDSWTPPPSGRGAILCGSVSRASLAQVAHVSKTQPVRQVDISTALADPEGTAVRLALWVSDQPAGSTPVICAARSLHDVRQHVDGTEVAPAVEQVMALLARKLLTHGITALVVAGGETSGAVVRELGIGVLHIGPELAPGVCWSTAEVEKRPIALALKSGNFGHEDFFSTAWESLA